MPKFLGVSIACMGVIGWLCWPSNAQQAFTDVLASGGPEPAHWCTSTQTAVASFQLEQNGKAASICRNEADTLTYSFGLPGSDPELQYSGAILATIRVTAGLWGEGVGSLAELAVALAEQDGSFALVNANGIGPSEIADAAESLESNGFYEVRALTGMIDQSAYLFRRGGWEYVVVSSWQRPMNLDEDERDDQGSHEITVRSPDGDVFSLL